MPNGAKKLLFRDNKMVNIMQTRRFCPRCGRPLLKSNLAKNNNYSFQCYACEMDFYKFEVLRKKDIELVKSIRKEAVILDAMNGLFPYSIKKPYPRYYVR